MTPRQDNSLAAESIRPLADRVRDRVAAAGRALDRRAGASRPKSGRPRKARPASLASASAEDAEGTRHAASLRTVFRELADTHRQYRTRTGQTATAGLREAATAFKQAPDLPALVVVAAFLDELGILAW